GPPKVFLAAVGELMTEVAGEVADGLLLHGFTTERYVREVTLPALERGLKRAGKQRSDIELAGPLFVITGENEEAMAAAVGGAKRHIGFYGSTPAYRPVLDLHGWGDLQTELNAMSKRGEWAEMPALVDDEVLQTFAVIGTPEEAAAELRSRYGDIAARVTVAILPDAD